MEKIALKTLKELHKNNKLVLLAGGVRNTIEGIETLLNSKPKLLEKYKPTGYTQFETTSALGVFKKAYTFKVNNIKCYILETTYDNSLDDNTSRNDSFIDLNIYRLK